MDIDHTGTVMYMYGSVKRTGDEWVSHRRPPAFPTNQRGSCVLSSDHDPDGNNELFSDSDVNSRPTFAPFCTDGHDGPANVQLLPSSVLPSIFHVESMTNVLAQVETRFLG